ELRRSHLELLVELATLEEESGNLPEAIESLRKAVGKEPLHEEANAALMRVYARSGWLAESVKQYRRFEEALRKEFDVEPGAEVRRTYREVLDGKYLPARASSAEAPRHNLPASPTSFVGREREAGEVRDLLAESRLLTIVGSGGSGKTRLAVEVARTLAGEYEGGAWMVELAEVADAGLLAQEIAGSVGVHEQQFRPLADTLVDELRPREALLVLDNCEHLVDEVAPFVEKMLGECPRLRVLATSREAIRVGEEVVWRVPPLSGSAAARLFVERAKRRASDFAPEENARTISDICDRLDGLPLAIELAAARVGALDVGQISARLDDRFRLLAGGGRTAPSRQRTMWAAIEWSDDLLDEEERVLFERLSVFAGGWSLEAAEHVGSGGGIEKDDILDLLSRLVDKSRVETGEARYGMLETIREYGRERLEESGEAERVRERHAEYSP
ncbi:MAG: ATP-binding protein, partial [Rubrobacteraceae bacterium]